MRTAVVPLTARPSAVTLAAPPEADLEPGVVLQQRRAAEHSRALVALMQARPDLAGVHPPADCAVAGVLWSA